ncbi:MAG: Mor transcription activator family protein [Methylococcaceae bacterium]
MIDFYAFLIGIIRNQLTSNAIDPVLAGEISRNIINELATSHGGQTVYLKNLYMERAATLNKQIATEYDGGASLTALSRKYQRSQAWIKKVIQKAENDVSE